MNWPVIITAFGFLFVFEGILPFLSPSSWRRTIAQMMLLSDRTLRIIGLISMLMGLCLVTLARDLY
jgi:uncharacterized protein YjeT (DUF2065 family)